MHELLQMMLNHSVQIDQITVDIIKNLALAGCPRKKNNAAPPQNNST